MQTIINLTAHTIDEVTTGQSYPTSGVIARVKQVTITKGYFDKIPLYSTTFGAIEGLPDPQKDTIYIVSALALNAVPSHRTDVVAPGNIMRNEHGQPLGCVGFRTK